MKRQYAADPYGPPPLGGPETVLRLLVSTKRVGSIIGKGGTVVKQVRRDSRWEAHGTGIWHPWRQACVVPLRFL